MPSQIPEEVRNKCETLIGEKIKGVSHVGGGDINEARIFSTSSGKFFLKMNRGPVASDMLRKEVTGLHLLQKSQSIKIPEVIGQADAGLYSFIIMENIEPGSKAGSFWPTFGEQLARLHQTPEAEYGLDHSNYIGSLPQPNRPCNDWNEFYATQRLQPQMDIAARNSNLSNKDLNDLGKLQEKLPELLVQDQPSLIHGDLWSGNYLCSKDNLPVLIDPAVCYAHREMDLAMSRLFGGFAPSFYEAYHRTYPLSPGWGERLNLYQLYYLLVHVNLFGGSYAQSVRSIVKRYV